MNKTRIEQDSMGTLEVPADALYAAQTQRAINNFPISGQTMPLAFIQALIQIKIAAAEANAELGQVPAHIADAIIKASQELLERSDLMSHFPVDIFQTGSGTSSNMNANEVIANLARSASGHEVSPNDHVNCSQSSNDVIPTAIHVSAACELSQKLLPSLKHFVNTIRAKSDEVGHFVKTGRTHLMDAMPVRMGQSLESWAMQVEQNLNRLTATQDDIRSLAQGGTAVGTGVNVHAKFPQQFCKALSQRTSEPFTSAPCFFTHIGSQDIAVALSGQLKAVATSIIKIANDLRWMNSGPLAGLAEIELEALQPGSSIMPGKVNPVIPEAAAMVGAQVIGNDTAISVAGQSGNFELNVMLPLIASNLLSSINLLSNVSVLLADKAISSFKVNQAKLKASLDRNPILVTALNPIIGYLKAADIAKKAYSQNRPILDVACEETDIKRYKKRGTRAPTRSNTPNRWRHLTMTRCK